MAKKVTAEIRLQIPAGAANPAPPVGPALGQAGVNIMEFCKQFNAATQSQAGMVIPVVITVYQDRSFTFVTKSPPAAVLIKKNTIFSPTYWGARIGRSPAARALTVALPYANHEQADLPINAMSQLPGFRGLSLTDTADVTSR